MINGTKRGVNCNKYEVSMMTSGTRRKNEL